jgi:DNA replication protein DnaC
MSLDDAAREARLAATPEGRKQLREEYFNQLRRRAKELDSKPLPEAIRHWARKCGCPHEALNAVEAGLRDSPAVKAAKAFSDDRKALFLLLLGPTGVGKSAAATSVVWDFCASYQWNSEPSGQLLSPCEYVDASRLTRLSAYDSEDSRFVERLRTCRLLVLEDVGDEGTDFGKGLLVELLMHRHASSRRTVLTANLTADAFKARYGEAVADRIRSTGHVPNLHGQKSQRRRPA